MNISFLVLNIFTALLGSLSFSLSNLVGEGWAVSVHGAHVITNLWMIGVLFSDKIPGRTIMLISGAQTLADASSAFLGLIFSPDVFPLRSELVLIVSGRVLLFFFWEPFCLSWEFSKF